VKAEEQIKINHSCRFVGERNELIKKLEKEGKLISPAYYCAVMGGYCSDDALCIAMVSKAYLPSIFGEFDISVFQNNRDGKEHLAVTRGDLDGAEEVPVRIHSQCQTGDIFGSLRCDCREQLEFALKKFSTMERAALLYLKQEGRGIGLANKIRAYHLQEQGLDTIEANHALGYPDEMRDYEIAAAMIRLLNIKSVALYTNNPKKIEGLEKYDIKVVRREPVIIPPNRFNKNYLETKKKKAGHLLDDVE